MQVWLTLILVVQLLSALVMIGLVLVQHGKGADMGASFGGGSSGSLFGATGSANFLSRSTAVCATIFLLCTLALAFAGTTGTKRSGGSVLDQAAPAASAPAAAARRAASSQPVPLPTAAARAPVNAAPAAVVSIATTRPPASESAPPGRSCRCYAADDDLGPLLGALAHGGGDNPGRDWNGAAAVGRRN